MSVKFRTTLAAVGLILLVAACAGLVRPGPPVDRQLSSAPSSTGSDRLTHPAASPSPAGSPAPVPTLGKLAAITPTGPATGTTVAHAPDTTAGRSTAATARPPRTRLPGWRLIFHEDFTTAAAPGAFLSVYRNFGAYPWGWVDTTKRGHYDPNILSVSGGTMVMHLHTGSDGIHRIAAPYPKLPGGGRDQLYGRYSVRFRADPVDGYKTAWLLWPQSEVWSDGEIDFPEGDLTGTMSAFLHYVGAPTQFDYFGTGVGYSSWHVATIEWRPNRLSFWLDGRLIGTSTQHVPVKPMHYVLQTETEIGSDPVPPTAAGNVQVDWVSIWRYEP